VGRDETNQVRRPDAQAPRPDRSGNLDRDRWLWLVIELNYRRRRDAELIDVRRF
jgi:hypothetical protein